jgi:hypothetical protein
MAQAFTLWQHLLPVCRQWHTLQRLDLVSRQAQAAVNVKRRLDSG